MRSIVFMVAVTLAAGMMAWHWRNGRVMAAERLQQALAVRPAPHLVSAARAPAPAPVPAPAKAKDTSAARAEFHEAMLPEASEARRSKNPQLAGLYRKQLRMEFLLKNGAFLRSRNLAGADRERLLAAWITNDLDAQDVRVLGREIGLSISDPALLEAWATAKKRMQETETAVLGPEGVAALNEYRQGQTIRDVVMNFQGEAAMAGFPLTLEQADAVAAILISSGVRPGHPARQLGQVDPATAERLLAGVLSPEQSQLVFPRLRNGAASSRFNTMVFKLREREMFGPTKP